MPLNLPPAVVAIFYMRTPIKLDYLWAGLCMVAAACFRFRGGAHA